MIGLIEPHDPEQGPHLASMRSLLARAGLAKSPVGSPHKPRSTDVGKGGSRTGTAPQPQSSLGAPPPLGNLDLLLSFLSFPFPDLSMSLFCKFLEYFLSFPPWSSGFKSNGRTTHQEAQTRTTPDAAAASQVLGFVGSWQETSAGGSSQAEMSLTLSGRHALSPSRHGPSGPLATL